MTPLHLKSLQRSHLRTVERMYGVTLTAILLPVLLALFSCSDRGVDPSDVDWPTTSPQEAGLDAQKLSTLSARIKSGVYGEIQSLLVVRHGQLVMEEYYRGTTRYSRYQVYSVTKSVNAILIGIAVSQGRINDLQSNVFAYFPEYADLATNDPLKQQITVEHLLTMTSGLNWDELTLSYNDVKNPVMQMSQNDDWLRFVLDRPMAATPGSKFRYNTGCSLLLGEILHRALGITVDEYARQVLFGPSGIVDWTWSRGSHDIINTGWGLTLRARDMAKIGQLYLQNGVWQNRQIVPSVWVQASVKKRINLQNGYGYGYQWWTMPLDTSITEGIKIAWGWGDQFVFVVPSLDLVVVSTGSNLSGTHTDEAIQFVPEYIIKAVQGG